MKTLKKKGKEPQRVFDIVAENMVKNQGWEYCPKSEWREKVRDAKPVGIKKKVKKKLKKKFIKVDDAGVDLKTGKLNG